MSAKRSKFDSKTTLYIVVVVLIIVAVAFALLNGRNKEPGPDIKTPDAILWNPEHYINKEIVVRGIYYSDGDIVANPTTDNDPYPTGLSLDLSSIQNVTSVVSDGNKYDFYGKLEWVPNTPIPNTAIILIVADVKSV